jgi:transposase-like protein
MWFLWGGSMNLTDLGRTFQTDDECIDYFERMRWPSGVQCLACESKRISHITSHGKTGKPRRVLQCLECGKQFTATCNTLFHDSHVPLRKWFLAIALMTQAKKGISSNQVGRTIGVSYKTAWHMTHRIREAMIEALGSYQLQGTVEIDETYLGGKPRKDLKTGMHIVRPKIPVIGMVERKGAIRLYKSKTARSTDVKPLVVQSVDKRARVMTDDSVIYDKGIPWEMKGKHKTINHSQRQYVDGYIHTNTVEGAFGLLKRGIVGSYHRLSYKHLQRYLGEFEFRWNNRKELDMFSHILIRAGKTSPLPYALLTAPESKVVDNGN